MKLPEKSLAPQDARIGINLLFCGAIPVKVAPSPKKFHFLLVFGQAIMFNSHVAKCVHGLGWNILLR